MSVTKIARKLEGYANQLKAIEGVVVQKIDDGWRDGDTFVLRFSVETNSQTEADEVNAVLRAVNSLIDKDAAPVQDADGFTYFDLSYDFGARDFSLNRAGDQDTIV